MKRFLSLMLISLFVATTGCHKDKNTTSAQTLSGAKVVVTVTDASGKALQGVTVYQASKANYDAYGTDPSHKDGEGTTAADGTATFNISASTFSGGQTLLYFYIRTVTANSTSTDAFGTTINSGQTKAGTLVRK